MFEYENQLSKKEWEQIKKEWLEGHPEPHFTISYHTKIADKIKNASLTQCGRIFICVIHTNFKEKETGLLVRGGKPLNNEGIADLFGLKTPKAASKAMKELSELGFISKVGRKYFLNKEYHFMGKVLEKDKMFSKIYHNNNRKLLQYVSPEALGLLYKLIPLVNYATGTVCNNPEEINENEIDILTKQELSEKLGIAERTLTMRMRELNEHGVVLTLMLEHEAYYKVSPRFVSKMDFYTANILQKFMDEQYSAIFNKRMKRKAKSKQDKDEC